MGNAADAEDLFQEILIKVWNNLESFRAESTINTWVYRIATNTALDYLNKNKKAKKRSKHLEIENLGSKNSENKPFYEEEKIKRLYQTISTLKEMDKIIISLLLEQCSYSEIAEITGISISNVGVRINRIKKTLAKKLN